jgi:hypothetical protein
MLEIRQELLVGQATVHIAVDIMLLPLAWSRVRPRATGGAAQQAPAKGAEHKASMKVIVVFVNDQYR